MTEKKEIKARVVERVCLFPVDCRLKDNHGTIIEMECPKLEIETRGSFKKAHKEMVDRLQGRLNMLVKGGPSTATKNLTERGLGFGYPKEDFDSHRYIMRLPFECSSRRLRFVVPFIIKMVLPVDFLEAEKQKLEEEDKESDNVEATDN